MTEEDFIEATLNGHPIVAFKRPGRCGTVHFGKVDIYLAPPPQSGQTSNDYAARTITYGPWRFYVKQSATSTMTVQLATRKFLGFYYNYEPVADVESGFSILKLSAMDDIIESLTPNKDVLSRQKQNAVWFHSVRHD